MTKKNVIGILAHVDAGKTSLTEQLLFHAGSIEHVGRVDHQNSFLDFDPQERKRGITIYSKETVFHYGNTEFYLVDTPGHMDFSAEMERSLSILDMAILLISASESIQAQTRTIWSYLKTLGIPCLIFVNKMDLFHFQKDALLSEIQKQLDMNCLAWKEFDWSDLVYLDDSILGDTISEKELSLSFSKRSFFPVLFGSALKDQGIEELLTLLNQLTWLKSYPKELGGRIYKVDEQGYCHVKLTGGSLKSKDSVEPYGKIDQLLKIHGSKLEAIPEASAGMLVAIKGWKEVSVGSGFGFEQNVQSMDKNAFMKYTILYPKDCDVLKLKEACLQLSKEHPDYHLSISSDSKHMEVQLIGQLQQEVFVEQLYSRSGLRVQLRSGHLIYQETIRKAVLGSGHFEPLRHYAEVHVLLEPLKRGSGIIINETIEPQDLNAGFKGTLLQNLHQASFRGILTNSLLTDVKISIIAAKGHLKHTVGGDFRQALLRAIRQALWKSESILLEPYVSFEILVPEEFLSKLLFDLENRMASVQVSTLKEGWMKINGKAAYSSMMAYPVDILALSQGLGQYSFQFCGYEDCLHPQEVIDSSRYDPTLDIDNSGDSVFCAHGHSFIVPWNESDAYMHISLEDNTKRESVSEKMVVSEADLGQLLERSGSNNRNKEKVMRKKEEEKVYRSKVKSDLVPYLLVDGYNMIFSWKEFDVPEELSVKRQRLIDKMAAYQAYTKQKIYLVFDGYRVKDNLGSQQVHGKMSVIYTKQDQTADAYLEQFVHDHQHQYRMEVASSDALVQNAVFAYGALRLSARELESRLELSFQQLQEKLGG